MPTGLLQDGGQRRGPYKYGSAHCAPLHAATSHLYADASLSCCCSAAPMGSALHAFLGVCVCVCVCV